MLFILFHKCLRQLKIYQMFLQYIGKINLFNYFTKNLIK